MEKIFEDKKPYRTTLVVKAPAKINLALDVLGTRSNGYHDVRMVMQTVSLYDDVTIEKGGPAGISVYCGLPYVPSDERNLAYKAAALLAEEFGLQEGIAVSLYKRIPVAAGLAGGSSDAAAVLDGVNRLFGLGLSQEELMERGMKLGADVPYCVAKGTMLAEGLGEKLTKLPLMPDCAVVLAKPSFSLSTKKVYQALPSDPSDYDHGNVDGVLEGLEKGDLKQIASSMTNVLETVSIGLHPEIKEIREFFMRHGALGAMMSGSGPTVFGLFASEAEAQAAAGVLKMSGFSGKVFTAGILNR